MHSVDEMGDNHILRRSRASPVPNLIITSEVHGDKTIPLDKGIVTIGRAIDHDVIVVDRKVSSNHAEVRRTGNIFTIRDLGSTNGTFVNGQRVTEAVLSVGDEILVGSTLIVYTD